jgi:hypothetical protein
MNKQLPNVNRLQAAMEAADADESAAVEFGEEAVRIALCEAPRPTSEAPDLQRQCDLDAALADAIEIVSRHRARLGRKVCSRHDGETVRRVFELLRGMLETGAEADPSFQ